MEVQPDQEETVGSYLSSWLQHSRTRVRAKTYEGYECLVRLYALPRIGGMRLSGLSPLHLQHLYADLLSDPKRRLSGGTVLNLHLVLTQALSQAVRWGVMASNPASGAQPPRPNRAELAVVDSALASRLLEVTSGKPSGSYVREEKGSRPFGSPWLENHVPQPCNARVHNPHDRESAEAWTMKVLSAAETLEEQILDLLHERDLESLRAVLVERHQSDVADVLSHLRGKDRLTVFHALPASDAPHVLAEADQETTRQLIAALP